MPIPKNIMRSECVGKEAMTDKNLVNGAGQCISAGSIVQIVGYGRSFTVKSRPCPHCGLYLYVSNVRKDELTLIEEKDEIMALLEKRYQLGMELQAVTADIDDLCERLGISTMQEGLGTDTLILTDPGAARLRAEQIIRKAMLCAEQECEPYFGGKEACEFLNEDGVCSVSSIKGKKMLDQKY